MQQFLNLLHFPTSCEFRNQALGHRRKIRVGSLTGFVHLPRLHIEVVSESFNELLPPQVRDIAFAVRVFDHSCSNAWDQLRWGSYFMYNLNDPAKADVASVSYAAITFSAQQGGKCLSLHALAQECLEKMPAWCSRLTSWIEVLTKADLDAAHSLPAAVNPQRWTTVAWVSSSGGKPKYDYVNGVIPLHGSDGKRAMGTEEWSAAIRGANNQQDPPEIYILLRDARAAQRRDRGRRSILDAATAVELIIDHALRKQLHKTHSEREIKALLKKVWQFSNRIALMELYNLWLPPGIQDKVMTFRNKVIHENASVTKAQAAAAIAVVEELADRYTPLKLP